MKALSIQDPGRRPLPPPDDGNILLEQIRTKVSVNVMIVKYTLSMKHKLSLSFVALSSSVLRGSNLVV